MKNMSRVVEALVFEEATLHPSSPSTASAAGTTSTSRVRAPITTSPVSQPFSSASSGMNRR